MPWTILADGLVAILLIATLVYVRQLSTRLETIRAGRAEFEKQFADFARITDQASSHLHHFKATADNSLIDLQARIERAQGLGAEFGRLGDDLKLLTERAVGAADRLDASVGRARFLAAATPPANQPTAAAPQPFARPASAISQHAAMRANALDRALDDEADQQTASLAALSGMR
jgi:hypothetical protein